MDALLFGPLNKESLHMANMGHRDELQIAIKLLGFSRGVTVHGGLPIPITTPAHGTAFDIATLGRADVGATRQAFQIACRMGRRSWRSCWARD